MKETENVPFDSLPPLIRGRFLTREQAEKLKEPFKDVVSIVRCKDCAKCHTRFCPDVDSPIRADDWYCADGERRTDDA